MNKRWWHLNPVRGIGWKHRLFVSVPMAIFGLIDNLVCIVTLGYIQPSFSLSWGFHGSLTLSRRQRKTETEPEPENWEAPDDAS